MADLYEIQVIARTPSGSSGNVLRLEHRFPNIPNIATLRALRDEAAGYYLELYNDEPEVTQIVAMRLSSQDVATQEKLSPVEWDWKKTP